MEKLWILVSGLLFSVQVPKHLHCICQDGIPYIVEVEKMTEMERPDRSRCYCVAENVKFNAVWRLRKATFFGFFNASFKQLWWSRTKRKAFDDVAFLANKMKHVDFNFLRYAILISSFTLRVFFVTNFINNFTSLDAWIDFL